MRTKITLAIVGSVIAALIVAGAGTFVLDRAGARQATRVELRRQAEALVGLIDETELLAAIGRPGATTTTSPGTSTTTSRNTALQRIITRIKGLSNLTEDDIGILVGPTFDRLDGTRPRNVTLTAFELDEIERQLGTAIGGRRGSVEFAAAGGETRVLKYVVVVARPPGSDARPAFNWFLLSSAGTILLGTLVAIWLSRNLTQRLRAAQAATHRIAAGDLSARISEPGGARSGDEVSDLAQSINSMASQLERSRGLERQFLMSVTHDLRTPLTSIQGYAEALTDGAIEPERAAATIKEQSLRLNHLVTDLLDLAKLDARSFSLDIGRVDVGAVVSSVLAAVAPRAAARDIALRYGPPPATLASADGFRLAQVVTNLVDNALKFAATTVEVHAGLSDGWVFVSVADDGPGIAPDDLPHVFERLYVAKARPTPKESGSGLGLAIVRELMSAMGGRVAAHSPVPATGSGTQMVIYLPPA